MFFNQIIQNLNSSEFVEIFSYYSSELFCLAAMILNLILLFLPKKKAKITKISNISTLAAFVLGFLSLGAILISNSIHFKSFDFTLLNDFLLLNTNVFEAKLLVILFLGLFFLSRYSKNRKYRCFNINLNLNILSVAFLSQIFVQLNSFFASYILFEVLVFLAYKYSSTTNFDKEKMFAVNYIQISAFVSILFLSFYFLGSIIKNDIQLEIINVLALAGLLAKIGIFPVFNHTLNIEHKNNVSFCILSFLYLPFLGCLLFNKLLENMNVQANSFILAIVCLLVISMISFSLFAFLQRNLFKFLIQAAHLYFSFCLINQVLFLDETKSVKMLFAYMFILFSLYCLLSILKENNLDKKVNLKLIKGLSYKDYKLANLIILSLLFLIGIFPNIISNYIHSTIKEIYVFDKYVAMTAFAFIFSNCLILFQTLKIIFACYSTKLSALEIKKGMILNYIIPILILLTLFVLNL